MATLFGSATRSKVLVAIGRLETTYPSELARVLDLRPIEVQRAVASLEQSGVIVTRRIGNTRTIALNRKLPGADELYALLLRMSEEPMYRDKWKLLRRRPRAMGKAP